MRAAYLPSERTFHGHCFCVFRNGSKTQPRSQSYRHADFRRCVDRRTDFIGTSISHDLADLTLGSAWPYVLLGLALLVTLGFEFVNGFHDTANAVATIIYTHSLDPNIAVVWSGFWNFAASSLRQARLPLASFPCCP
jgi:hypothetical protein